MDKKLKNTVEEILYDLPEDMQDFLLNALEESKDQKDFIRLLTVGNCPVCGSENTRDCEGTPLDDPTVYICLDCNSMGCLECGVIFKEGQNICKHWEICDDCEFYIEEEGCGVPADECSIIQDWKDQQQFTDTI
jgi:hypothetical protein